MGVAGLELLSDSMMCVLSAEQNSLGPGTAGAHWDILWISAPPRGEMRGLWRRPGCELAGWASPHTPSPSRPKILRFVSEGPCDPTVVLM